MEITGSSQGDIGSGMDWMICVPQLYSSDPSNGYRGSCLSACFEMVSEYLFNLNKSNSSRSSTVGGWLKGGFYPNRIDRKNKYFWNQALLHNYVWADMSRLIELACKPSKYWPIYLASKFSIRPDATAGEIHLNDDDTAFEYTCVKGQDDYLKIIKYTLKLDLPLIVLVKNMKIIKDESSQKYSNEKNAGKIYHTVPDYQTHESEETNQGHFMIIYGMAEEGDSDPLIRILDPEPSVDLRKSPDAIFGDRNLGTTASNDLHYFYLRWSSLREFISRDTGLTVFEKSTRAAFDQQQMKMREIRLKSRQSL